MEIMDCILLDWETYSRPYRKVIAAIYNAKQFDKLACKDVNEAIQQLFKQEEDDDKQYTSKS
jgi:hypothetical protein